ncbi:MAG: Formate--tetrahydrofolate ligase, partial [Pelotomaculum thermopropionicum]
LSEHWLKGGEGALELADAVIDAAREKVDFKFLYPAEMPLKQKVETIAREIYGADGVSWSPEAAAKAAYFEAEPAFSGYSTMMVKTHLSLSHDPAVKGVPRGWVLPVRDILVYAGAGFLCPVAGTVSLMPGTGSDPAYRRIDVDVNSGEVLGLF